MGGDLADDGEPGPRWVGDDLLHDPSIFPVRCQRSAWVTMGVDDHIGAVGRNVSPRPIFPKLLDHRKGDIFCRLRGLWQGAGNGQRDAPAVRAGRRPLDH